MRNTLFVSIGFIVLISMQVDAQVTINPQTDTIKWQYTQLENMVKSEKITLGGYLISYSNKHFLWTQNGIDRKYTFDVKSSKGEWPDISKRGELIYRVTCNGEDGTLRMVSDRSGLKIILDFVQPEKSTPHLVLLINGYAKI